jgi:polyisoprenoid-binding protein YceI
MRGARAGRWTILLSSAMMLASASVAFTPRSDAAAAAMIEPARTSVEFTVDAVGWPRTKGRFTSFSGRIAVDLDRPDTSSVAFRVAANSIDVGSDALDRFLRGAAFLDVAHFPDITFASTKVVKIDDKHARISGDLTLRGVARPFAVDVEVAPDQERRQIHLRATGVLHRLEYGLNAGFPAVSNDINLIISTDAEARGS